MGVGDIIDNEIIDIMRDDKSLSGSICVEENSGTILNA